ncbi:tRNA uridine 5-oxyacetic acid(34) methyltransferase CmoM [Enterobacillus tribolii]|uniref:tRNA 5-carboxymethoxyuridine methyltransferase n=1 Tax=Enterobacillus tribolii TaxID=1487935 RepID=A0A370QMJ2_9GAMM|nr:tRNA uridine 5-oxyacetic acid(34) methyltransferase CmoM [Enterobacillus tribolii]MBW7982409.1 tRNA uridine 5-oxyacetic acid(34) methyltransferase CmoM [Enterobacillus tribolii]RDK89575.1 2-polyprenyl-3-methyl-5-hydroxy-6-metoxy-1,4-benzoquinol methylase [Enterobacillus tribolii]
MQDRNFDDIADKFTRNIYGTTKGEIRRAVLWQDLQQMLTAWPERQLNILDAGGGMGQMSSELAALGHRVILCDISAEMLSRAQAHAEQKGVSHNMQFIQSPAQEMVQHLEQPVDLILFHAVLEWVADPRMVLQSLYGCLRPGGALSLMFYNYNALLMRNIVLGNLDYVKAGMPKRKRRSLSPDHPLDPARVYDWLEGMGMHITGKSGVRVFHDYMQNKRQQIEDFADVLALEQRYCRQEPFVSLGRYIHVMARKPTVKDGL